VAFRSDEDNTSHEAMQAALQARTDSISTTTGATSSGYTTSAMTSFPATSTSAFPDQGTIIFLDARGSFTYTSKTATSFVGVSQNVGVTSWSSAATINLRSDHYLGIYYSESCWARYSVKYTRRYSTDNYIACSVDLIDSIGAPTSISGGSNSNPSTNSNSGMTLNTVLIQFADYIPENYAAAINRQTTTIDGGKITTGTITASQINLTSSDVGARADDWTPSASEVGARDDDWVPSANDLNLSAGDVNAGSSATSGSRMNITSSTIKIYDGSDLRVTLGYLGTP
jgi:hypothetical protein